MLYIGTDIIELERIERAVQRQPALWDRLLSSREKAYCCSKKNPIPSLAGFFAAKEAIVKCLETGLRKVSWHDMEIIPDELGCPRVYFTEKMEKILQTKGISYIKVSISHSRDYAVAVAIGEDKE